ncbi:MAG: spoIIQ [Haloplasmataceae bacterium]|jgi:stage II sporulation protein Q|nr:spoIIQ [Haloplasmataceae bacterium]
MNNWNFTGHNKNEVMTVKNKLNNVFKKFQSYSFIIFLALVLGAFFALAQLNKDKPVDDPNVTDVGTNTDNDPTDGIVKVEDEKFIMPIADALNPELVRNYYDLNASLEEKAAAIIEYDNYFFINQGADYTVDKEADFEVLASLSGTVTKVQQDMTVGWMVEVEHLYGVKTVYNSLADVNVAEGDTVAIGDVLGTSGSNDFDPTSGVHVHFEVVSGNSKLNPEDMIGTGIAQFKPENE